jgi:hypothetical protein
LLLSPLSSPLLLSLLLSLSPLSPLLLPLLQFPLLLLLLLLPLLLLLLQLSLWALGYSALARSIPKFGSVHGALGLIYGRPMAPKARAWASGN